MEKRLFYLYLKYVEKNHKPIWKHLGKISTRLKWLLGLMIVFYVAAICMLVSIKYLNDSWSLVAAGLSVAFVGLCILFGVLLFWKTEKYEIDISDQTMKDYWDYCKSIREWFQRDFLVSEQKKHNIDANLLEVKKRVDDYVSKKEQGADKKNERIDKWVQALAIPFVLAIITSVLEKNEQTVNAISEILTILMVLSVIIGVIWVISSISRLFKKQKLEQMRCFSEDLQGAIDYKKYSDDSFPKESQEELCM